MLLVYDYVSKNEFHILFLKILVDYYVNVCVTWLCDIDGLFV